MVEVSTVLLGILTSYAAELVTAINKKLQNTVLKGDGAFLIAFGLSLVGAVVKEAMAPGFNIAMLTNWQALSSNFAEVFAISQVYFVFVAKKLNLDVQDPTTASAKPSIPA